MSGVLVGHATDEEGLTGCTAVLFDASAGAVVGVDVRGSSPGTRETDLLDPIGRVEETHALLLTGGSAFGLGAADGVVRFLEEKGVGYDVRVARVPIVPAAVIFDLPVGDSMVRPDAVMGYEAAAAARSGDFAQGSVGAGTGASVGKVLGLERAMKGGLGSASAALPGGIVVAALAVVNAFGDVRDSSTGKILAGSRKEDGTLADSMEHFMEAAPFTRW
ncbi:MAG: P1 family peptidase, partial [Rubrobacter sp.]|nr:P1 family peptidase [Rubrobacter sp.]